MKNKKKLSILLILCSWGLIGSLRNITTQDSMKRYDGLTTSPFYFGPIIIDDNGGTSGSITWAEAVTYSWCSGGGTENNPYIINDLTIDGSGINDCLIIKDSSAHFVVRNSYFYNSGPGGYGVKLLHVTNGKLDSISSFDSYHGIQVIGDNNQIINSWAHDNRIGISVSGSYNLILSNNVYDNTERGVELLYKGNNTIDSNFVWFNENGIWLSVEENDIVSNNIVHDNIKSGITFYLSYECSAIDNKAYRNDRGILLSGGVDNKIKRNEVYDNSDTGIWIVGGDQDIIMDNEVKNNANNGINIDDSNNNIISKNIISRNQKNGIYLFESDNNLIFENKLFNNTQTGIFVSDEGYISGLNTFYNNTFIINTINAIDNVTSSSWDFNGIGNYWDDYFGKDLNDDGIGDTPYLIPGTAGNQDQYPIWDDGDDLTPDIIIKSPSMNDVFGFDAPDFDITINDASPINTTWYTIDGGANNYTFPGLTGTLYQTAWDNKGTEIITLRFYANDSFGNIGFKDVVIWKDLIAPKIRINAPTPNQLFGVNAPTFSLTINEPNIQIKRYSINGRPNITFTIETQLSQSEWNTIGNGTVLISFYVIDKAGNTNSSEVIVRKDAFVPDITIISPISDEIFGNAPPEFSISIIEEDLISTWYTVEGSIIQYPFIGLTGTIDQDAWNNVPQGEITITFYAQDGASNIGSETVVVIKSIPAPPAIPGYNVFLLIGTISVLSVIIMRKQKHLSKRN